MKSVISSEWLKLRSVSSTYHAIGAAALTVALGVAWTLYVAALADERGTLRAAAPEQGFLPLVQVSLAVLGVLAITSEYATGMVRTSLIIVPKRSTLLLAKAGIIGMATFVTANTILLLTYATSRLIANDRSLGFNQVPLTDDLPMLLASGLSVTALALVGLGLGAAMRSTAGAIMSVVALLFVLPGVATYLPAPWNTHVSTFLLPNLVPQVAGERLSSRLGDGFLPSWAALALLLAYPLVALAIGYYQLRRRDA
ncbi:ABC-type transport system involved in multi-copper enzyme maturation permease subunit [Nonomuraea thailandensis]|uniref:ABC-type transport system involved in multi-copper enzyme maturation permease subunit n=1 Tax=Nonomuraea thailandensis TaxID=1188745 RepID=A0A9X2K5V1_9ACTN|nr:ABC transporter permease subunit [Nonomuraea thailandensis]MCP2360894.1 ABC-type transport system involved in multi-copper enzyme maturation permease subunit [Nonomuraea thailandensis]